VVSKEVSAPTSDGLSVASRPAAHKRVLLIDYDDELAEVMGELLKDDGLDVVLHTCSDDHCICVDRVLETKPDLVLVNVAHSSGWATELQGWRCLQNIRASARTRRVPIIGYSVFDSIALEELEINPLLIGVKIRAGISNPGQFADEIARLLVTKPAA